MGSETRTVARFIQSTTEQDVPEAVRNEIVRSLIDGIGCALLGSGETPVALMRSYLMEWGTTEECTVWGTPDRAIAPIAGLLNAMATHQLDYDDTMLGMFHPASVTVPAAMAIADRGGIDGRSLITAVAVGYDVINTIGWALEPRTFANSGFYNSVAAIFGPVAVVARLLNLTEEETQRAIAIAATNASGLYSGTTTKRINGPFAVFNGVVAAELAQRGLEAPLNVLEAPYSGFLSTFVDGADPAAINTRLGRFDFQIYRKWYPCIRSNHPAVDCVAELITNDSSIAHDNIERITVHADTSTVNYTVETAGGGTTVQSPGNAKISLPYCVAAMIVHGELTPAQFSTEAIHDPAVQSLLHRIDVVVEPEFDDLSYEDRYRCVVDIECKDGSSVSRYFQEPKGDPGNRMSETEIREKFISNVTVTHEAATADHLFSVLQAIETVEDVREVTEYLAPVS